MISSQRHCSLSCCRISPIQKKLWPLLNVDRAPTWIGWVEVASELETTLDDASMDAVAADYLVRFCRIIMNKADLASTTDEARRCQLQAAG